MTIPDGVHGRLGDQRGFLHKSFIGKAIGGVVKRVIPGVGIASDIFEGVKSFVSKPPARRTSPRTRTARVTPFSQAEKEVARRIKFENAFTPQPLTNGDFIQDGLDFVRRFAPSDNGCEPPLVRGPRGLCIAPTSPLGASRLEGIAVLGKYGSGIVAGSLIIDRATCGKGMQLGDDGICYNKSQISNKQRMWPAGRKPLLTGGDMRAISTAARAGKRMDLATKRLQKMGMMKKPTSRRGATRAELAAMRHAGVLEGHAAGGSRH